MYGALGSSGPQTPQHDKTDYETFRGILDDEVLDLIVLETNRYADQFFENNPDLPPFSRARKWQPLTRDGLIRFIGLTLLMSLNDRPRLELYWSRNPLFSSEIFGATMSRDR